MPRDGNAEIRMISARSRDPTLEGGYRFIPLPKDVGRRFLLEHISILAMVIITLF